MKNANKFSLSNIGSTHKMIVGSILLLFALSLLFIKKPTIQHTALNRADNAAAEVTTISYADSVKADGPLAYWRLGDLGTLTAKNEMGLSFTGKYTNSPVLGKSGAILNDPNTAAGFNGSNSWVNIPYSSTLNPQGAFSIETWANPTATSTRYAAVAGSRNFPNGWVIYKTNSNRWALWINSGSDMMEVEGPAITLNTWTQLAATYDGTTATLYINGAKYGSNNPVGYKPNTKRAFAIGQGEPNSKFFFNGTIDEVSYYNKALSASQIANHYAAAKNGGQEVTQNTTAPVPITTPVATAVKTVAPVIKTPTPVPLSTSTPVAVQTPLPPTGGSLSVQVSGNHFINQNGQTIRLIGVNRTGTQYACSEGWGFFDGPNVNNDDASIATMKSWGINAVRINMNEHCWLGLSDVKATYGGTNYQNVIGAYVQKLNAQGIYAIIDMHFNGAGVSGSTEQGMADRDHATAYWTSVSNYFKNNHAVVFDLYNEPYPDNNRDTTAAWTCVRDGGTCPGISFVTEGMQQMLNAVRATGATHPVMISGPEYAGSLRRWLEFKPSDPLNQLVASVHIYGQPLGSPYDDSNRWNEIATVAQQVPIVMGEIGDTDCTHKFIDQLMPWADSRGISYIAWSWSTSSCSGEPGLISNFNGTPTNYGIGFRDHVLSLPR